MDIHKVIGKLPRPKKGYTLPGHKYTGPYNPLDEQLDENDIPIAGQEPFNAVDAISMRHDICYRDDDTKAGKKKCDDKMLIELDILEPKNIREKIDRSLVRKVISAKKRLGWGIEWSNELADELHKPIRKKFQKRLVFAKNVDDIWAADLVEMQSLARFNNGNKYILMVIDVFSKYGWAVALKSKTGIAVADALRSIFRKEKKRPAMLWTDKGKEFYNKHVADVLRKNNNIPISIYKTVSNQRSVPKTIAHRRTDTQKDMGEGSVVAIRLFISRYGWKTIYRYLSSTSSARILGCRCAQSGTRLCQNFAS